MTGAHVLNRNGLKWAFTTRRVAQSDAVLLQPDLSGAIPGDLVLCEIAALGQHRKIQLADRRNSESYFGDRVVLCLGDRYAPDQFEGRAELAEMSDLLAGGGIVGSMKHAHARMAPPTKLRVLGLVADGAGRVLNVARYALPEATIPDHVTVLGVFGASMNAGKTTAAVSLAHGLTRAGLRVAGVKATGTGAFGDFNAFEDAGVPATDFTDAGMPTTYCMPMGRIEQGFATLVGNAAAHGAEVVVVEIADGVFQAETAAILQSSTIRDRMDGILFAAPDALGAYGGVELLKTFGLRPFAISGMVTLSPLGRAEAERATGIPLLSRQDLTDPAQVTDILGLSVAVAA
ncbi:dethiobiotin synthase [Falsirhodobacter xinxiangensis]|uniref:dethiobiotin synthase n=1 Tax=Falsirhodobacter xinxiangensis TaxID=2530049 RepID=UPI0010AA4DAA|nr:dethiobiotin synthase [Rhodobacter xinxiangensis]